MKTAQTFTPHTARTFEDWLSVLNSEQEAFHAAYVAVPVTVQPEPESTVCLRVDAYREELLARGFKPGEITDCIRRVWGCWTLKSWQTWQDNAQTA